MKQQGLIRILAVVIASLLVAVVMLSAKDKPKHKDKDNFGPIQRLDRWVDRLDKNGQEQDRWYRVTARFYFGQRYHVVVAHLKEGRGYYWSTTAQSDLLPEAVGAVLRDASHQGYD